MMIRAGRVVVVAAVAAVAALPGSSQVPATLVRTYDASDAAQGVAVDRGYVFALDTRSITELSRASGRAVLRFAAPEAGPLVHMDSGAVYRGRLYAAHSNYGVTPMESSVEVFDARTLRHVASRPVRIDRGSLTWIDRHDGTWWAGVADYDHAPDGQKAPYGGTDNTRIVRMDDRFRVLATYAIPEAILDRFKPMSNSGGSWGPDGRLWLTGHDRDEAYAMALPTAGTVLRWTGTVELPGVEGQGIAWDRAARHPTLWAIDRSAKQVLEFDVPFREVADRGRR